MKMEIFASLKVMDPFIFFRDHFILEAKNLKSGLPYFSCTDPPFCKAH